jgi:hypothetical protein
MILGRGGHKIKDVWETQFKHSCLRLGLKEMGDWRVKEAAGQVKTFPWRHEPERPLTALVYEMQQRDYHLGIS